MIEYFNIKNRVPDFEFKKDDGQFPNHQVRSIFTADKAEAMREVAQEFGLTVSIVATAGQQYTHQVDNAVCIGIVQEGDAYVAIDRQDRGDLEDFYIAADKVLAQRQQ